MAEGTARERIADPPSGTVTFLFTDIEGSTALWESYPAGMPRVLWRHDEILRSAVEEHDGYVFKTVGDAFCATFSHPRKALCAALKAQRSLFGENWGKLIGSLRVLRVRMALHTGYAELERDRDYFGPAVNRVARLMNLAHGGQVLLSGTTHDQVCDRPEMVDKGAQLVDLEEQYLKDLARPERVFQLAVPGLPKEFPPLRTHEAREEIEERYHIKRLLGSGGFAKVYLAHDEELDQDVAYKVLHPLSVDNKEEFAERFKREARNAAKPRSHPNVVAVYDRREQEDGTYYMVMEYLPGGSLEDLIDKEGPLPTRRALGITLQIADALSEAHGQGVIHRDVKPENVLLTKRGDAKVGDFGISKAVEDSTRLTRKSVILGTVHYISPEQAREEEATFRSDLYALGVVLYQMLVGELPLDGSTTEILNKHFRGERACSFKEANPNVGVPEQVEAVVMRLLASNPDERYQNATELMDELKRVLRSLEEDEYGRVAEEDALPDTAMGEKDAAFAETTPGETGRPLIVVEVPDLTGQDVSQASSTLAAVGLKLGGQNETPNDDVPEGEIVGQEPAAGTEVEAGSSVSVTVGLGPKEAGGSEQSNQLPGDQLDAEDWFNEGNELAEQGRYEEAIEAYDQAINLRPGYFEALNDKGIALDQLGHYEEAIKTYDQAIGSINPGRSEAFYNKDISSAWYNKGFTLDEQRHYEEAIEAYDQAIRIKPNHSDAWNNKGVALRKLGRYEEATKAYDRAIRINPDHPCARSNKRFAAVDKAPKRRWWFWRI